MLHRLEDVFDKAIRPSLKSHGGNIEIIDLDNDTLYVKMHGGCQGCTSSQQTLRDGIENLIKKEFPMIQKIVDLTDHGKGENPYYSQKT
jgi:Fe-S cluster biogenesis protein NfuA